MDEKSTVLRSTKETVLVIDDASESQNLLIQLNDEAIREGRIDVGAERKGADLVISKFYKDRALALINPTLVTVKEWLSTAEGDCEELGHLILALFDEFVDGIITKEITYRRVFYLGELLRQLDALKLTNPTSALHGALQKMLKQLNLNTETYYNYCIARYSSIIAQIPDAGDKLAELKNMKRRLLNTEVRPGYIYNMLLPDIKHQLQDWLRAQTALIANQPTLNANQPVPEENKPSRTDLIDEQFKMDALMRTEVLAVLFRALVDGELIAKPNFQALFRFAARYFRTTSAASFQAPGFHTRFYEKASRRTLIEALVFINKMEGVVRDRLKNKKK